MQANQTTATGKFYHIWAFNKRRNQLQMIKSTEHKGSTYPLPAAWERRSAANEWAKAHPKDFPHGFKVMECFGPGLCDMGDHERK